MELALALALPELEEPPPVLLLLLKMLALMVSPATLVDAVMAVGVAVPPPPPAVDAAVVAAEEEEEDGEWCIRVVGGNLLSRSSAILASLRSPGSADAGRARSPIESDPISASSGCRRILVSCASVSSVSACQKR